MTRPNILVLSTDQQRWDALGANGNEEIHTPNLDRLAENGVNFDRTFVQNPVCMPSRASYMTGRYPSQLRIYSNGISLPEQFRTLPEYFTNYGYETANIGKLHFLPHANRDHSEPHPSYGFDHLEISDEPGPYEDAYRAWVKKHAPEALDDISVGLPPAAKTWQSVMGEDDISHPDPRFSGEPEPFPADDDLTHTAFVGRRTIEFLEQRQDTRFLCVSGFYSPHQPWVVPQRYLDLYDREELSVPEHPPELAEEREAIDGASDHDGGVTFSEDERRGARHGYYAMVSEVDHWVGRILDTLEEQGIRENTIVVFMSDHGDDLGDHLRYGKGFPGWDAISRVPFIVHWPDGITNPGRTESGIAELVDLLPTLLDASGIPVPTSLQGESLTGVLNDAASTPKDCALTESGSGKILRTDRYRYALEPSGEERLYDLEDDPGEYHNRADDPTYDSAISDLRKDLIQRVTTIDIDGERPRDWDY